jgi:hypothetical protein
MESNLKLEVDWAEWGIHDKEIDPSKMEPESEPEANMSESEGNDEDLEPEASDPEMSEPEDSDDEIEPPPTPPARDVVPLMDDDDSNREVETLGKKGRVDLAREVLHGQPGRRRVKRR